MQSEQETARRSLGSVPEQLAELERMTVGQLVQKFRELYGRPTFSRNKFFLQKRLAWRIQELAEGGLHRGAVERIAELGDRMPEAWRKRLPRTPSRFPEEGVSEPVLPAASPRDSRLPAPGEVLVRAYRGDTHRVTVLDDGFDYRGKRFTSLSRVAREITGTQWNGLVFFGLEQRGKGRAEHG